MWFGCNQGRWPLLNLKFQSPRIVFVESLHSILLRPQGAEVNDGLPDIEVTMKDFISQPGVKGYILFNELGGQYYYS